MEKSTDNKLDERIMSFFETSKNEIFVRIKLRDSLLAAYATATAAIFTFTKTASGQTIAGGHALLIVPYVCFAFTLLICYHHLCIATLGAYIKFELHRKMSASHSVHVFETWSAFKNHRNSAQRIRTLGQAVILVFPTVVSLWSIREVALTMQMESALFWLGVLAVIVSLVAITITHVQQRRLRGRRHADNFSRGFRKQREEDILTPEV